MLVAFLLPTYGLGFRVTTTVTTIATTASSSSFYASTRPTTVSLARSFRRFLYSELCAGLFVKVARNRLQNQMEKKWTMKPRGLGFRVSGLGFIAV